MAKMIVSEIYEKALELCKGRNKGDIMCGKLRELHGMSAKDILTKTQQLDKVVVDVERILKELKISAIPKTFSDIEAIEQKEVAGLVLAKGDEVGIFYDSEAPLAKKRFIMAHELGHCCFHDDSIVAGYIEYLHEDGFENEREKVASTFAARLLVQEKPLQQVYDCLIVPTLGALADIFEVPEHLMKVRLNELGMKYYIRRGDMFVEAE